MVRAKGTVLTLLGVRDLLDDCLIVRATRSPKVQREYQAVLKIDPVNFPLLAEDEQARLVEGWRVFLVGLAPTDRPLCLHLRISPYDLGAYLAKLAPTIMHPVAGYREMAEDHQRFVQDIAANGALLTREFYVRVSILITVKDRRSLRSSVEERREQARADLTLKVEAIMDGLSRAGLTAERLRGQDLERYYQSCVHTRSVRGDLAGVVERPGRTGGTLARSIPTFAFHLRPGKKASQTGSLLEFLAPASVEETPHYVRVHHDTDEYVRARAVIGYPPYAIPGWVDHLLAIDEPGIDVLLFVSKLESASYVRKLNRKLTNFNTTQLLEQRQGKTENPWIARSKAQVEELRGNLVAQTEQVYTFSLYLLVRADNQRELRKRDTKMLRALASLELQSVALEYEHLLAWQSCLDARDILRRARTLDTSTIASGFPFSSNDLSTEPGMLLGLTPAGGLLVVEPTSAHLENGQILVFAKSGSGKSFVLKVILSRQLMQGRSVVAIDAENEYNRLCEQYEGTRIDLSPGHFRINPFDLGYMYREDDAFEEKIESVLVLFDLLLAENLGVLPQRERSYLRKLVLRAYANHGIDSDPRTHQQPVPTMREIYDLMAADHDPFQQADRLFAHLAAFPDETDARLENQLVIFDMSSLKSRTNEGRTNRLLPVGLYLLTEFLWGLVRREETPRPRLLIIDEAWVLMEFPEGAAFLAGISRRARKHNLHLCLATQNIEDFFSGKAGRTILLNAAMKLLLHHDDAGLDIVVQALRLSEEERHFLKGAAQGQGIFFSRESHVPIFVAASQKEYQLMHTDSNPQLLAERVQGDREDGGQEPLLAEETRRGKLYPLLPRISTPQEEDSYGT